MPAPLRLGRLASPVPVPVWFAGQGRELVWLHKPSKPKNKMQTEVIKVGDIVRPANNGEDKLRRTLHWIRLRGTVRAVWDDCGEQRVEVRWDRAAPYPTRLPAYLLKVIQ